MCLSGICMSFHDLSCLSLTAGRLFSLILWFRDRLFADRGDSGRATAVTVRSAHHSDLTDGAS